MTAKCRKLCLMLLISKKCQNTKNTTYNYQMAYQVEICKIIILTKENTLGNGIITDF